MAFTIPNTFTRGKLTYTGLNANFQAIQNWLNAFALTNPLSTDLDVNNNFILNARVKKWMRIRNAQEFSSLNAAITDITSEVDSQYQGGVVYCPPGIYDITAPITMADDIYIIGAGWKTILRKNAAFTDATGDAFIDISGVDRCGVSNLQIDGQNSANADTGAGIAAIMIENGADDVIVQNVFFNQWGNATDGTSDKNAFILVQGATTPQRTWIIGNRFNACPRSLIELLSSQDAFIIGNKFEGSTNFGIYAIETVSCTIQGNVFSSNNITFEDSSSPSHTYDSISGNIFRTGHISLEDFFDGDVSGNVSNGAGTHGIDLIGCNRVNVVGNVITDNSGTTGSIGIQARSSATYDSEAVLISGNMIQRAASYGIAIGENSGTMQGVTVQGNHVFDCGQNATGAVASIGIVGTGLDDLMLSGNHCVGTGGGANLDYGIELTSGATITDSMIFGNRTEGHDLGGIQLAGTVAGLFENAHNMEMESA